MGNDLIDENAHIWLMLRHRRSHLHETSLLGKSSSRRKTFAAAMQQFEEQMHAAKVVSAFTRPINLYYGLVQAGQAISAAHAPGQWSFDKHGLKLLETDERIPEICVRTDGDGAFQRVAAATCSPMLTEPVSLGKIWASLPELSGVALADGFNLPTALGLLPDNTFQRVTAFHGPGHTERAWAIRAAVYADDEVPDAELHDEWLASIRGNYLGAQDAAFVEDGSPRFESLPGRRFEVRLEWPSPKGLGRLSDDEFEQFFDSFSPKYRYRAERYLRPSLEKGKQPPSPMMTWWLLLYSFSMLARYQPRLWGDLLDIDSSKSAHAIQYVLDEALSVIPHFVLEALDRKPFLLPKTLQF